MKESYIGDINDFYKYDLIEKLSQGKKCLVVWMQTSGDGNKLEYLEKSQYEKYNEHLFKDLKEVISENTRVLKHIEKIQALKNCVFCDGILTKKNRKKYFEDVYKKAKDVNIVFFDPDKGITPNSNEKEIEYIYWDELLKIWEMGKDILVYQSYRHEKRDEFIKNMVEKCEKKFENSKTLCFKTKHISFFYISRNPQINCDEINEKWGELEK